MIDAKTIVQSIYYLLRKNNGKSLDKIKIIKLMYLADKYHLLKYGRTITNDNFYAMPNGPIGSVTLDILNFSNTEAFNIDEGNYTKKYIEKKGTYAFVAKDVKCDFNRLSKSDKEVLDFIFDNFAKMDKWALVDFTHKYPEWKRYENLFKHNKTLREVIPVENVLSRVPEDPFSDISNEHIADSREIVKQKQCRR